jgi:hypothetical protein
MSTFVTANIEFAGRIVYAMGEDIHNFAEFLRMMRDAVALANYVCIDHPEVKTVRVAVTSDVGTRHVLVTCQSRGTPVLTVER